MANDSEITIRDQLNPGDIGYLVHIQSKYYFLEFGYDLEFEAYICKLFSDFVYRDDEGERMWIVEKEGTIVGSIGLFRDHDHVARLRLLFLHPDVRGRGLGRKLVDLAVEFAKKAGYSTVVLMTEDILKAAGRIYMDAGFEVAKSEDIIMWGVKCKLQTYEKKLLETE